MRYIVAEGELHRTGTAYCVWDDEANLLRFSSDSKPLCIQIAQRMNGLEPADGDETTYARQVKARAAESG